jgi:Pyruvate/2-oxoglutarate dehydrogenase complex, dehydrogenase (E1) component, eukaryotic type, alpha subunit
MLAERVDGFNPLAVIEAYGRKKKLLLEGKGPALLDVVTYRFAGHSPSDSSSYRTKEEIEAWQAQDPIIEYRKQLIEAGVHRGRVRRHREHVKAPTCATSSWPSTRRSLPAWTWWPTPTPSRI